MGGLVSCIFYHSRLRNRPDGFALRALALPAATKSNTKGRVAVLGGTEQERQGQPCHRDTVLFSPRQMTTGAGRGLSVSLYLASHSFVCSINARATSVSSTEDGPL